MEKEKVILKKGKEKIIHQRHHWIFSGAIHSFPKSYENGTLLPVYSFEDQLLGYAYFNKKTSLTGRIVSFNEKDPLLTLKNNILEAYDLRKTLFNEKTTNSFRIIHAEGDFCPGLIVDKYAEYLVIQIGTLGMENLKPFILAQLKELFPVKGIYEKSLSSSRIEEGLPLRETLLWGEIPDRIVIQEEGLRFFVSVTEGQKTGFFLDQRAMRLLISSLSHGKKILNTFSYTGGFSIYALKGGAQHVDSLDASSKALALAEENVILNGFNPKKHHSFNADVFSYLRDKKNLDYDLAILDPPSFAKKRSDKESALNGYTEINSQAMKKMPAKSLLLTCSCSYFISEEDFKTMLFRAAKKAKREIKILSSHHQSFDHPINIYHPENEYLKGFLLYIGKSYDPGV